MTLGLPAETMVDTRNSKPLHYIQTKVKNDAWLEFWEEERIPLVCTYTLQCRTYNIHTLHTWNIINITHLAFNSFFFILSPCLITIVRSGLFGFILYCQSGQCQCRAISSCVLNPMTKTKNHCQCQVSEKPKPSITSQNLKSIIRCSRRTSTYTYAW